jgi:hypothetical protein
VSIDLRRSDYFVPSAWWYSRRTYDSRLSLTCGGAAVRNSFAERNVAVGGRSASRKLARGQDVPQVEVTVQV